MAVKYVALDLHQASTSISIRDVRGRVIRREVVPTRSGDVEGSVGVPHIASRRSRNDNQSFFM